MDELLEPLLRFYRGAQEYAIEDFDRWLFQAVGRLIRVSSAIIADFQYGEHGLTVYSMSLHNEPESLADDLPHQNTHHDRVLRLATSFPSIPQHFAPEALFPERAHIEMRDYFRRYRHRNAIVVADVTHPRGRGGWISLYRGSPDDHFTAEDARLLAHLTPHILESQIINRHLNGVPEALGGDSPVGMRALSRPNGVLIACGSGFTRVVRGQWPDWRSARLPQPLLERLRSSRDRVSLGDGRLAILHRVLGSYVALEARPVCSAPPLGRRELQIASLFASAHSHKEIARLLDLSPTTVRNVLAAVYRKLTLSNKVALARSIAAISSRRD